MAHFIFAARAVVPVFLLILLGLFLRRIRWINQDFIRLGSSLVFHFSLPALLILKISSMDPSQFLQGKELWAALGITFFLWLFSWLGSIPFLSARDQGVFAQGAFRSNMAIIGLAIVQQVLGDPGVQKAAILIALLIPVFNILATFGISIPLTSAEEVEKGNERPGAGKMLLLLIKKLVTNPLMIAIALGFLLFLFSIKLPPVIHSSLEYLGRMSLPLALICIGGGIDFSHFRQNTGATVSASLFKVLLMPLLGFAAARILDMDGLTTVVFVIIFGAPTAVSSFPMAHSLGGNKELAANIVALSTLLAIATLGLALTLLGMMGYLG